MRTVVIPTPRPTPRATPSPPLRPAVEAAGVAVADEAVVCWASEVTAEGTELVELEALVLTEVLLLTEVVVTPAVAVIDASPISSLVESLLQQSSNPQHHSVLALDLLPQAITHSPPVGFSKRDEPSPGDFQDAEMGYFWLKPGSNSPVTQ